MQLQYSQYYSFSFFAAFYRVKLETKEKEDKKETKE